MFAHRSSGKIGTAGVKPTPVEQKPAIPQVEIKQEVEETVFRPPKEKRKKFDIENGGLIMYFIWKSKRNIPSRFLRI